MADISDLVGVTLKEVRGMYQGSGEVTLVAEDGRMWRMEHWQDCCESVSVEDVVGDKDDLIGSPIVLAEERNCDNGPLNDWSESYTWTYYAIATNKGHVDIRWYGSSNGYYGEGVNFEEITDRKGRFRS